MWAQQPPQPKQPKQPKPPQQPRHLTQSPRNAPSATFTTTNAQPVQLSNERINQLTDRAQRGDADALRELRQAMTTDPWLERRLSDFARFTREHMVRLSLSAKDLLARDVLDRQLAALRQELEASVQSPLERLLVERILTCWIAVQLAEVAAADPTILTDDPATQRLDRAHRRYLTAIQALARVSQLLAPIIAQVNIAAPGAQQLNLAAPHLATSISSPPPTLPPAPTLTPNPTKPA